MDYCFGFNKVAYRPTTSHKETAVNVRNVGPVYDSQPAAAFCIVCVSVCVIGEIVHIFSNILGVARIILFHVLNLAPANWCVQIFYHCKF